MIYALGAASLVVQILCVLHVLRTGRNQIWIWIIMFGSFLGCTAYFAFELMPEIFGPGSRFERTARARVEADPVSRIRTAEEALGRSDTAASRLALGDAHMISGAYREAAQQYRTALDRMNGSDPKLEARLAEALFEGGDFRGTLASLDRIAAPSAIGERDRLNYLRARALAELGEHEGAAGLYADLVTRLPGEEARCRYAALLLAMGRKDEAKMVLEDVAKGVARLRREDRDAHTEMFGWAERQRRELASNA